jgi:hypothetical protein
MSAYRSPEPRLPFVLRIRLMSDAVVFGFLVVIAILVAIPFAAYRPITIVCERGSDLAAWKCAVSHPVHTASVDVPRSGIETVDVKLVPLDDGGSSIVANGRELARFHRRDGAAAAFAARDLSRMMGTPDARAGVAIIDRSKPSEWFAVGASLFIVLLVACAYLRPLSFMVDAAHQMLFVKQGLGIAAIALSSVESIRARGAAIEIAMTGGLKRSFAPAGWTHEEAVSAAHALRDALENARPENPDPPATEQTAALRSVA